ncbi:hypothetical protein [Streptomyces nigrescens]
MSELTKDAPGAPGPAGNYAFDPRVALGWKDIGLDGLGCFLRSVESVLLHEGYDAAQVARGLSYPLDLVRRGEWYGPESDYPACRLRWVHEEQGADAWPEIERTLADGRPVVLMYDGFHWPGDPYEGEHHYHHHMVLAHRLDTDGLHLLDTDAPADEGYARRLPVTDRLVAGCNRYALFDHIAPPTRGGSVLELAEDVIAASVRPLAEDIAELRAFHRDVWSGARLPLLLAKGLDVIVLGDIQPQLFVLGHALDGSGEARVQAVADALLAAARRAQKLGLLVMGLHRYNAEGVYSLAHEEVRVLTDRLEEVLAALCACTDTAVPDAEGDGSRFVRRLRGETAWCFGEGRPLPETPFA